MPATNHLVLDANILVLSSVADEALSDLAAFTCHCPPLAIAEALSAIRESVWREELTDVAGRAAIARLQSNPVRLQSVSTLESIWNVAARLGWAKTYDAEYIALAIELNCPLLTLDERLKRGASYLHEIIGPTDLFPE